MSERRGMGSCTARSKLNKSQHIWGHVQWDPSQNKFEYVGGVGAGAMYREVGVRTLSGDQGWGPCLGDWTRALYRNSLWTDRHDWGSVNWGNSDSLFKMSGILDTFTRWWSDSHWWKYGCYRHGHFQKTSDLLIKTLTLVSVLRRGGVFRGLRMPSNHTDKNREQILQLKACVIANRPSFTFCIYSPYSPM